MHVWKSHDPAVFEMLRDRKSMLVMVGIAMVLVGLFAAGITAWPCPLLRTFGIPCPGCGLTRGVYFLLRGDIRTSLTYHAFAPVFGLGAIVGGLAVVLPERFRSPMLHKLDRFERHIYGRYLLLFALIIYWLARLVFLNTSFVQLIRG
jgi:hypothetical protein